MPKCLHMGSILPQNIWLKRWSSLLQIYTDVAVISCFQKISCLESIDEIWLKFGIGVNIQYLPIHDLLGFSVVELLPGVHLITGYNSVSSLFRIGKKNAFETLKANSETLTDMRLFGDSTSLNCWWSCDSLHQIHLFLIWQVTQRI